MYASGMTGLRWYSYMNHWMDFIAYVPNDKIDEATAAIHKGLDDFWEGETCEAYGDCVELALSEAHIPYVIVYQEWDDESDSPVDWWDWDRWVGEIVHDTISIAR